MKSKALDQAKWALSTVFNIETMSSTQGLKYKSNIFRGLAVLGGGAAVGLAVAVTLPAAAGAAGLATLWGLSSVSCNRQYKKKKDLGL